MPNYCSAFGCTNSSTKESCRKKGISFHKFPLSDKLLLCRWLVNIRRANFEPTPYSYICSEHFSDDDFEYQPFTNRRGLRRGAIPTRFSFNSCLSRRRKKRSVSNKNHNHEVYVEDPSCKPVFCGSDTEASEIQKDDPALVEMFMNEKFYPPERFEALANGLQKSSKTKQKKSPFISERIIALKKRLRAQILLRSLKKQLLDAEIKAANAKRDYYEAKYSMLSEIEDVADSENSSESDSPLQNIKTRLKEEELSAHVEERMLQEQLEEAQMLATYYEKEYCAAKSSVSSSS